jgi:hypothetical protein
MRLRKAIAFGLFPADEDPLLWFFVGRLSVRSDRPNSGSLQVENFNHILEK